MECNRCCSGYRVDFEKGDLYCGFCGAPVRSFEAKLQDPNGGRAPFYIDQPGPIEVKIVVRNDGLVEIDHIGEMEIT